jgi:hypothetical protein
MAESPAPTVPTISMSHISWLRQANYFLRCSEPLEPPLMRHVKKRKARQPPAVVRVLNCRPMTARRRRRGLPIRLDADYGALEDELHDQLFGERAFQASLDGDGVSPRMTSASAQEEIDEITRKFLRPRGDIANMHLKLLA